LGGLRAHRWSLALLSLGVALSVALFGAFRSRIQARERLEFRGRVDEVAATLRSQLERPLEVLESVCALFDSSVDVSRAEFSRFVQPALTRHPGIRALEWLPLVPASERSDYERAARADGLVSFQFTELDRAGKPVPAAARPEYFPIFYMEPGDERVFGFDVASERDRRQPIDHAAARQATVASERIRLIEDPPDVYSIAVFCPVFRRPPTGVVTALRGTGAEVFRMRDIVTPAIQAALVHGMQVAIFDVAGSSDKRVLFESSRGTSHPTRDPHDVRIDFADRQWILSFARGPNYRSELSQAPWGVLLSGIALSLLLGSSISGMRIIGQLRGQVRAAQHLGKYTLIRKLGEGGMGMVWEARHALLRRPTAIKLLRPDHVGAAAISRFEREVQLTSQLTHPNTVAIYDYGRTSDGVFYYVMEYLDGFDLQRLVAVDGSQLPARVVHILKQVVGALAEAHARGLVHRDVKPANIVLCERGGMNDVAKVVDFGLVKRTAQPDAQLSAEHAVIGTPLFLAPEALTDPEHLDGRSDLYAVGAVAYFLLTGQPVFDGGSLLEICSQHMYAEPQPPSERLGRPLPQALEQLVLRCLAKRPDDRFASAGDLLDALAACGVPLWTEAEAKAAWARVANLRDEQTATARTIPISSPSQLAVDLDRPSQPEQSDL
jgi:serine/threonine protein kinase/CHASE1-domain containing sensor protein